MNEIVRVALAELGNGEDPPGKNAGPHIEKYMGPEYKPGRNWCAGFVAYCLRKAGFYAPASGAARRGARACVRSVAGEGKGQWIVHPSVARLARRRGFAETKPPIRPGDVICWYRGWLRAWKMHIGFVESYNPSTGEMVVIHGNVGDRVERKEFTREEWLHFLGGLYGIARAARAEKPGGRKFRKRPVVIEAYQTDRELDIETLEGAMRARVGDWIITGVNGEQYPCRDDIFQKTYEPVD